MRPYLAVLKDSFREALANRILWVTFAVITVVLVALLPISITERPATTLRRSEILEPARLIFDLRDAAALPAPSPGKHLWPLIDEEQRKLLVAAAEESASEGSRFRGGGGRLTRELNKLLTRDDFFSADSWKNVELTPELRAQAADTALSGEPRAARNRALLAAAFPRQLDLRSDRSLYFSYAWTTLDLPLPVPPDLLKMVIKELVANVTAFLLGTVGVFISILVTASIVPRTYEAGEIALLLSKPISRSWLFLAKFLGGCAFTLLNVAYLIVGLWLILGWRFDVWNHKLLLGIPIYLFLFAIYFSVSAWAGARWRNAILSVAVTLIFWSLLFALASLITVLDSFYIQPLTIVDIVPVAGDDPLVVTSSRDVMRWDESAQGWNEVFESSGGGPPEFVRRFAFAESRFLPVYILPADAIIATDPVEGRFGALGSAQLVIGRREENWDREELPTTSETIREIFATPDGRAVGVSGNGIYELQIPAGEEAPARNFITSTLQGLLPAAFGKSLRSLHPAGFDSIRPEDSVAQHPQTGELAVLRQGTLTRYAPTSGGGYEQSGTTDIDAEKRPAVLGFGNAVVAAFENGDVRVFAAEGTAKEYRLPQNHPPRLATVSPDGRYIAIHTHAEEVWVYDAKTSQIATAPLPQGKVTAVAFDAAGRLLFADHVRRVRAWNPATDEIEQEWSPPDDATLIVYHWIMRPLYLLLPKPQATGQLVVTLMTDTDVRLIGEGEPGATNLRQERAVLDVWTPVWSNLAFLCVMLALACRHVERRDY